MIRIGNIICSLEIVEKHFICDLNKCHGTCCVQGDSGAPLTGDESELLSREIPHLMPFLTERGKNALERFGPHMIDQEGDIVTPLVNGNEECAFAYFENGIARCAIEKAFEEGKTGFRKPLSCHLYPIRMKEYPEYITLNYDVWGICQPARDMGERQNVPVYRFVREALERRFGEEWFRELDRAAREWNSRTITRT